MHSHTAGGRGRGEGDDRVWGFPFRELLGLHHTFPYVVHGMGGPDGIWPEDVPGCWWTGQWLSFTHVRAMPYLC